MVVYLSGPMTGMPENGVPVFNDAAQRLRAKGLTVISPPEIGEPSMSYEDLLDLDLRELAQAQVIALLPGWQHSKGVGIELVHAQLLGIPIRGIWEL